jgi:ATP-dependent protease ClpP protease subunit
MKEILIYGDIGWDVDAKDVVKQFQEARGEDVLLRIHSTGGSVLDGEAILQAIRNHDSDVTARIDGMAYSMAAVIALEFSDTLSMPEDAWIMFHEVSGGGGQVKDLERQVQMMAAMNESIVAKLSNAMGISREEATARLADEIWMNGKQAHDAGLVANLTPSQALAAHIKEGAWKNPPKELSAHAEPIQQNKKEPMKGLFKVFQKESSDDSLQVEPVDFSSIENEAVNTLRKENDELKATHAAEIAAKDEKLTEATNALKAAREKREELENTLASEREAFAKKEEAHAKALEASENSANEKANEILAQAGHAPVETTEANEQTIAEQYQAMKPGEERRKFRNEHKEELAKVFGHGALR